MNTGLFATLILGLFIIVGALVVFLWKDSDKFVEFSLSLAFGVMTMLIFIDLLPEAYEAFDMPFWKTSLVVVFGAVAGFLILHILDRFIPDHEDDQTSHEDDERNLKHIGFVSSIALVIHNIVEGMSIYLLIMNDFKAGLMASIGVGLHNIPLGMVIASAFYKSNHSKKKTFGIILGISLSTFVGGLLMYLFRFAEVMPLIEGVALIVTLGMLLYILVMELLPKVLHAEHKKITLAGLATGVLLLLGTLFL